MAPVQAACRVTEEGETGRASESSKRSLSRNFAGTTEHMGMSLSFLCSWLTQSSGTETTPCLQSSLGIRALVFPGSQVLWTPSRAP